MLMRRAGLAGPSGRPRWRPIPNMATASDLVDRNFHRDEPDRLWVTDIERREAFLNPAVVRGHRVWLAAVSWLKLRAAGPGGTPGRVEAALTTTGRASTVRWCGSGWQDGKAYVRNQWLNAPQEIQQLESDGSGLRRNAHPAVCDGRGTSGSVDVAGREVMVGACGVVMTRLQGHGWAPTSSTGSGMNVGTISLVGPRFPARAAGAKTCRRLMRSGWGAGFAVVRARQSRAHGEGTQCGRSFYAERGVRW